MITDTPQPNIDAMNLRTAGLRAEMADLSKLAERFGNTMVTAFAGAVIHGRKLSDVLKGLVLSFGQQALSAALKPLGNLIGNSITPFAGGGIVNSPTLFPMRGGTGLMGEAGPEAIIPLARGPNGKLGIRGSGMGGGGNITINISTPDIQSFRQSQGQVSAMMARAISRGQRNL